MFLTILTLSCIASFLAGALASLMFYHDYIAGKHLFLGYIKACGSSQGSLDLTQDKDLLQALRAIEKKPCKKGVVDVRKLLDKRSSGEQFECSVVAEGRIIVYWQRVDEQVILL